MAEPENGQGFVTPTPFGLPGGDADSDGDCDASDVSQVNTWWSSGPYDVRGDVDLDGDVDATDSSTISTSYYGIVMGRGVLSDDGVGNRRGYAGYEFDDGVGSKYHVRHRAFDVNLGRWSDRGSGELMASKNGYYKSDGTVLTMTPHTAHNFVESIGDEPPPPSSETLSSTCFPEFNVRSTPKKCWDQYWRLNTSKDKWLQLSTGAAINGISVEPCAAGGPMELKIQMWVGSQWINLPRIPWSVPWCEKWHGNGLCLGGDLLWAKKPNSQNTTPPTGSSNHRVMIDMEARCPGTESDFYSATSHSGDCTVTADLLLECNPNAQATDHIGG